MSYIVRASCIIEVHPHIKDINYTGMVTYKQVGLHSSSISFVFVFSGDHFHANLHFHSVPCSKNVTLACKFGGRHYSV